MTANGWQRRKDHEVLVDQEHLRMLTDIPTGMVAPAAGLLWLADLLEMPELQGFVHHVLNLSPAAGGKRAELVGNVMMAQKADELRTDAHISPREGQVRRTGPGARKARQKGL